MKILLIFICFSFVSGCTKLMFATANAPKITYEGKIFNDISYGLESRQSLDIYVPEQAQQQSLPVVVFFHGGRWTFGSKDQYKFVGMSLSSLGYIVVLPNTRLFPEVKFPTFVEDAADSIAWVFNNIGEYGGNNNHFFVSGHSSGAHIGALLTANNKYLQAEGLTNQIISGFAGLAGPYDFEPKAEDLKDMFGPPENYPNMAVTTFIKGDEAPMLLMYSADDETVHVRNLEKLKAGIQAKQGKVNSIIYESGGHTGTVAAFSWANPSELPVKEDIDAFFRQHIK